MVHLYHTLINRSTHRNNYDGIDVHCKECLRKFFTHSWASDRQLTLFKCINGVHCLSRCNFRREISLKEYYPDTFQPINKSHNNGTQNFVKRLPSLEHTIHLLFFCRCDMNYHSCNRIIVSYLACVWSKFNRVNKTKVNLLVQWSQTVLFGVEQIIMFRPVRKKDLATSIVLS